MMMRDDSPPLQRPADTTRPNSEEPDTTLDADELLSLLGDEYAREILTTLGDQSLPARDIVDRSNMSRPTVYRRLNRLEEAGLVETRMSLHPDDHHRKEFQVVVEELELRPRDDTLVARTDYQTADDPEEPSLVHASD